MNRETATTPPAGLAVWSKVKPSEVWAYVVVQGWYSL